MKKYVIVVVLAVILIGIAVFTKKDEGKTVKTAKAEKKNIAETVSGTGTVKPVKTVNIMSDIMGKIIKLPVKEGDIVKKGDLLCVIDDKNYRSELDRVKEELKKQRIILEKSKIDLEDTKREFERKKALFASGIISKTEFEQIKNKYKNAVLSVKQQEFTVKQTQASLKKAEENLQKTRIVAPINGKITSLKKELGEHVIQGTVNNPGSVIMVISDMSKTDLEIEVNEIDAVMLKKGMSADVYLDSFENKVFKGKVKSISESAEKPAGKDVSLFKVKISLLNPDVEIKPGMSGRAEIIVRKSENAVVIPIEAVKKDDNEKEYCFKVENSMAVKTPVKTGISNDFEVEIIEGISENDTVITGPYRVVKTLKNGDKVKIKND